MSRARALRRLEQPGAGASIDTLYKRAAYGGRKGRRATRRLARMVKANARFAKVFDHVDYTLTL